MDWHFSVFGNFPRKIELLMINFIPGTIKWAPIIVPRTHLQCFYKHFIRACILYIIIYLCSTGKNCLRIFFKFGLKFIFAIAWTNHCFRYQDQFERNIWQLILRLEVKSFHSSTKADGEQTSGNTSKRMSVNNHFSVVCIIRYVTLSLVNSS